MSSEGPSNCVILLKRVIAFPSCMMSPCWARRRGLRATARSAMAHPEKHWGPPGDTTMRDGRLCGGHASNAPNLSLSHGAVDAAPADAELPGNLGRVHASGQELLYLPSLGHRGPRSAYVLPFRLRLRDALTLPLQHRGPLVFGNRSENLEHHPAGGRVSIKVHAKDTQAGLLVFDLAHNVEKVAHRPR